MVRLIEFIPSQPLSKLDELWPTWQEYPAQRRSWPQPLEREGYGRVN
jgi:hypothetical protein